jgi:hypothetical protein
MKKRLKRRDFLGRTTLAALATASLGACTGREDFPKEAPASPPPVEDKFSEELAKNRQMPRDLVMKMLDQKGPGIADPNRSFL